MRTLIAADLDNTLIYSATALNRHGNSAAIVCVETKDGNDMSYMTAVAANALVELAHHANVVPATTRTPEQLARVTLPGPPPRYEIAANGGVLFVDGQVDQSWNTHVARALSEVAPFDEMYLYLQGVCHPQWTINLRAVGALFCYAVVDRAAVPLEFIVESTAWALDRGWSLSLQGRKVYWVPKTLTKAAAMSEVARRTEAPLVLAAGDSLLDIDMLLAADHGAHPAHGEIADSGWSAENVEALSAQGIAAGQEICRWFLTRARTQARSA